jgi:hypothetical protein
MFSFVRDFVRFIRGVLHGFHESDFVGLFTFVTLLLLTGTLFYHYVEHWTMVDAFYFTVTTLATVGFGDFAPKTDIGKLFTVFYIMVGVGTLLGFINLIAHHTREHDPIHLLFSKRHHKKKEDDKLFKENM